MKNTMLWSPKNSKIKSFYFNFHFNNENDFAKLILANLEFNNTYSVLLRIEYDEGRFGMVGKQIGFRLNTATYTKSIKLLYDRIIGKIETFTNRYSVQSIDSIQILIVNIDILPKLLLDNVDVVSLTKQGLNVKNVKSKFKSSFLPLTTNTDYLGKIVLGDEYTNIIKNINEQKAMLHMDLIDSNNYDNMFIYNGYIVLNKTLSDNVIKREIYNTDMYSLEVIFIDTIINDNTFSRKYNNVIFTIKDNNISNVVVHNDLALIKYNYFKSTPKQELASTSNPFIGTFDLEAYTDDDGFAKVYAVGYNVLGKEPITYYHSMDYDVLLHTIDSMLIAENDGYIFYIHNLNYDGVFILNKLKTYNLEVGYEYYKINTLFRDGSILKLEIGINRELQDRKQPTIGARQKPRDIKIIFVDSSNLLRGSLHSLCKAFSIETPKGYFPYKFVNLSTLNYKGDIPDYKYWNNTPREEYDKLVKSTWNLKEECLYYLNKDLSSLLEIMTLFNKYITRKFDVQMTDSLTISRLSLNIYLKHYMRKSKIPIVKGNLYNDIKEAYFGGVTEVYRPHGENLYYYDVNSLYPFAALNPMCSNKYYYIESHNESIDLNKVFGFFYCEIETSNNYIGLLPIRRIEGLVMPNGKWKGWYFSEELKFAADNGYKINIIKGYNFEQEYNVFDNYVKDMYKIKSNTTNKVEKAVAKSLLNNLLGRFGLNIYKILTDIVDRNDLDKLLSTSECNSFKKITDNAYLISYKPKISKDICESHGYDYFKVLQASSSESNTGKGKDTEFKDVSLVISAAVTAYARIYMAKIKLDILNKGGKIYYTDTDSIVTDIKLDDSLIDNSLGNFKLEHEIKEGYFISSKTYLLILHDDTTVVKTKGLLNKSLTVEDFTYLYEGYNVQGLKTSSTTNYEKGSVTIDTKPVWINHDAYTKRIKIFDNSNKWVDTKPIVINEDDDAKKILPNLDSITPFTKTKQRITNLLSSVNVFNFINTSNIISLVKFILISITYMISAIITICLLGEFIELYDNYLLNDKDYYSDYFKDIDNSNYISMSECTKADKSIYNNYKIQIKNLPPINTKLNDRLINSKLVRIYESVIHDLISDNIHYRTQFNSINNVIAYTDNYLINEVKNNNIKITTSEYIKLKSMVKDIKYNNPELYNMICYKKVNSYNIISQHYLDLYKKWITESYTYKHPGEIVVKNQRTLSEELELYNNYILESKNKDIYKDVNSIPRSISHMRNFSSNSTISNESSNFNKIPYIDIENPKLKYK